MIEIKTTKGMRELLKEPKKILETYYNYRDLLYELGDSVRKDVIDEGRWTTFYEEVYKLELEDGVMFICNEYEAGNTEYQTGSHDVIYEVEPYEVVTTRYKRVK